MDRVSAIVNPLVQFSKDSIHFINRCTKPDRRATAVGFLAMGVLGFIIKLIFVPINSIIVGIAERLLSGTSNDDAVQKTITLMWKTIPPYGILSEKYLD